LEVLRQTSGRAASQASVGPFHFRWARANHSNHSVGCIGITLSKGQFEDILEMPVAREELKTDAPAKRRRFALLDKNPDPSAPIQRRAFS
jgi:hypothetical protein